MTYQFDENTLTLSYLSKDGEEGYPGNLQVDVLYSVNHNTLKIQYKATTDQDTIINLTNHSYFNLSGVKEDIYNHQLMIQADCFGCVDEDGLTTGEYKDVTDTPFDFRKPALIGSRIDQDDEQLKLGNGFDHPFVFSTNKNQVELIHEASGRKMIVSTTMPTAQIYTANYLDGLLRGKNDIYYQKRDAVCIETQFFPDSIHIEEQPKVILKKGDVYDEETSYTFEVIK